MNPALLALLGGAAGAFPDTTSSDTQSSSKSASTTNQNSDFMSWLNTLMQLAGKTTQTGTTAQNTTQGYASPAAQALQDKLLGQFSTLGTTDFKPYIAQQSQQINTNSDLQAKAVQSNLAARGLANSPIAANADVQNQAGRVAQITSLQQSVPLLQRQQQLENMAATSGFLSSIPKTTSVLGNTTDVGTSDQTQTGVQSGKNTGSTDINNNTNVNANSTTNTTKGGGVGGFAGGLTAMLTHLFG